MNRLAAICDLAGMLKLFVGISTGIFRSAHFQIGSLKRNRPTNMRLMISILTISSEFVISNIG